MVFPVAGSGISVEIIHHEFSVRVLQGERTAAQIFWSRKLRFQSRTIGESVGRAFSCFNKASLFVHFPPVL